MLVDEPFAQAPGEAKELRPPRGEHAHRDQHDDDGNDELQRELKDAPQHVADRAGDDRSQKRQRRRRELLKDAHGVTRVTRTVGEVDCSSVGVPR